MVNKNKGHTKAEMKQNSTLNSTESDELCASAQSVHRKNTNAITAIMKYHSSI